MPAFDDDDELESYPFDEQARRRGRREGSWDVEDEGPDERDLAPDNFSTVRCTTCNKLIFEDTVRCPYCKDLQVEVRLDRKPIWLWVAVTFCCASTVGLAVLWLLKLTLWHTP